MKNIDPKAITVRKVLCPFCSFGCDFGVVLNDFGIKGVEYMSAGSSGGRLCPRGSAAAMYLDHPKRLSMPLKKGKSVEWSKMGKELSRIIGNPKNVAVTIDRNVTPEEYSKILGFCKRVGIEDVASTYFEPEFYLRKFHSKPFSISEIEKAQRILILGDPFDQSPMSSRAIIDWKLNNKKNRLVVVDSINTHTAGFADEFLRVGVGTEPLLLFGLAQAKIDGVDIARATGVDGAVIREVSDALMDAKNGVIFACLSFGHTYDPILIAEGLSRLQESSGMKVVPFVEFAAYDGTRNFTAIVDKIKKKKIKYLLNFGELFPFYYPQLLDNLRGVNIYATSPLKYNDHNVLPVPLTLEKEGSVITTFGKKKLSGNIEPPSGAKSIDDILNMLSDGQSTGKAPVAFEPKIDVQNRAQRLADRAIPKKKGMRLIGEKIAFSFLGFFEPEALKINPIDAVELGITANDMASVTSKHGSADLMVKLSEDVGKGIVAVAAETPVVKGLFAYEFDADTNNVNFIPTEVKICRKE
ncbi:MAG: molybdopterin dinucleotide binding domain-containing protein [bacterium]